MTQTTKQTRERTADRQSVKFAARRGELAEAALHTLSELGYARTSLREIAQNSKFSHGVLHYYFRDKVDLIAHCVKLYKARCVTRYDGIVANARTPEELATGFGTAMAATLRDEAAMHRLWYDLRNQTMFEPAFAADVTEIDRSLERMIWRIVDGYAKVLGTVPVVSSEVAYAMFDGLFLQSLLAYLGGEATAPATLSVNAESLLLRIVPPRSD